ncbi:hypothetical protein [Nocardioides alcanivorans]|uniref:hypothetical protein n=1 Tax=Nocardioides alcanivorans TaxID=2897352 RepID=UPI001F33F647|nr:hypothetical protein [Nocardioides alcanivorans]
MRPVTCLTCAAEVLARKSSWDQTTVQWSAEAVERCVERKQQLPPNERPNRNAFLGCHALKDSVRAAAVRGALEIQDEDPLKTNPEAHQ